MTIKEYQKVYKLESEEEILKVLGYGDITYEEMEEKLKELKGKLVVNEKIGNVILIGNKKFDVPTDFKKIKYSTWSYYDSLISSSDESEIIDNLHKIIGCLVIDRDNKLNDAQKEIYIQDNMEISDGLGLGFFLLSVGQKYIKNTRIQYLQKAIMS